MNPNSISLRELLDKHDNDYVFDCRETVKTTASESSLSVIIPYYNTGPIFEAGMHHLTQAIGRCSIPVEVIVVDDGSESRPANPSLVEDIGTVIRHKTNLGRTEARNTGLEHANNDTVLFMDSDVLIDNEQLNRHIFLQDRAKDNNKKAIVVSFFQFIEGDAQPSIPSVIESESLTLNDYRLGCLYGPTWIGCEEDKKYVGETIDLVTETNEFKSWRGQYKAWVLPNMILGGLFSVQKQEIEAVGGFDSRFQGYGFTETSAVTKMIALRNNVVIPSLVGGGYHIDDPVLNVPRKEKDEIFWRKHDFYFNTFLQEQYEI